MCSVVCGGGGRQAGRWKGRVVAAAGVSHPVPVLSCLSANVNKPATGGRKVGSVQWQAWQCRWRCEPRHGSGVVVLCVGRHKGGGRVAVGSMLPSMEVVQAACPHPRNAGRRQKETGGRQCKGKGRRGRQGRRCRQW